MLVRSLNIRRVNWIGGMTVVMILILGSSANLQADEGSYGGLAVGSGSDHPSQHSGNNGGHHHSHRGGYSSGAHYNDGNRYQGGYGVGGFGSPFDAGFSSYGYRSFGVGPSLGYPNFGVGPSLRYGSLGLPTLGYSGYGQHHGGYSPRPIYSTPAYTSPLLNHSEYQVPIQSARRYYQPTHPETLSRLQSRPTVMNPDGTPAGELRPGMVLPDGAIVVSVGPLKSAPRSAPNATP